MSQREREKERKREREKERKREREREMLLNGLCLLRLESLLYSKT